MKKPATQSTSICYATCYAKAHLNHIWVHYAIPNLVRITQTIWQKRTYGRYSLTIKATSSSFDRAWGVEAASSSLVCYSAGVHAELNAMFHSGKIGTMILIELSCWFFAFLRVFGHFKAFFRLFSTCFHLINDKRAVRVCVPGRLFRFWVLFRFFIGQTVFLLIFSSRGALPSRVFLKLL